MLHDLYTNAIAIAFWLTIGAYGIHRINRARWTD